MDLHQENVWGRTALFGACGCDPERLERAAQEMIVFSRGPKAYIPLDRRPREVVRALLEAGARVGHADSRGECALMRVEGDVERVRMLVAKGADVNQADEVGRSVLMRCMKGQVGTVRGLVGCFGVPSLCHVESAGEWTRAKLASVEASWAKHLEVNSEP